MSTLALDYIDRKKEAESYFNFIEILDNVSSMPISGGRKLSHIDKNPTIADIKYNLNEEGYMVFQMMKANSYLVLYNLIEWTVYACISAVFEDISDKEIEFQLLNIKFQEIWLEYASNFLVDKKKENGTEFAHFDGKKTKDAFLNIDKFVILDYYDKEDKKYTFYEAYLKLLGKDDFSGNIDMQQIREQINKKYGFEIPVSAKGTPSDSAIALKKVKDN